MPSSRPAGASEFLCQDVQVLGGVLRCANALTKGDYLCRNRNFCLAQGAWGNQKSGESASMPCGMGFSGDQTRPCMNGEWGAVDRSGCELTGTIFCGRGSRNADCECAAPQEKYTSMWGSDETYDSGFKYSGYGMFTGMKPGDYVEAFDVENWDGQGLGDVVYYCGAPNRGPKCGPESGVYTDCGCPAGEVMQARNSRAADVEEEYSCVPVDSDECGSASTMECTGGYEARDIDCLEYEGARVDMMGKSYGLEGKFCREEDGVELFFKVKEGEAACGAESQCAAECADGRRRLRAVEQVGQPVHHETDFIGEHREVARRILAGVRGEDDYCVAVSPSFALRCRDLESAPCHSAKQCVSRNQDDEDANAVCNRVNESSCAGYSNPRFGQGFCEVADEHACSWHHEDETHFREYCRTKDHWFRPDVPCRGRRNSEDCDEGGHCEWVTEEDATDPLSQLNDLDRCSRYDNFETLCGTINSCVFECNYGENALNPLVKRGQERGFDGPHGRCQGHLKSQMGTCRLFDNDSDCNNEPSGACFWNYLGNCRCRSGERPVEEESSEDDPTEPPVMAPTEPAGPSEECTACLETYENMGGDFTCELHRPRYECVPASEIQGECTGGSGTGTTCSEWTASEEKCTKCPGMAMPDMNGNPVYEFFNTELPDAPTGQRGYFFCESGRGLLSARCLPDGSWGQTSGACVEVSCPALMGTNWSRAAGDDGWVYADCESESEEGFMRRKCKSNGEWGPIENQCSAPEEPISCGISKDLFGVWMSTEAGTRVEQACSNGYHGKRVRVCSTDGHWGPIVGECFKECYDVIPPPVGGAQLTFRDMPSFEVRLRNTALGDALNPVFFPQKFKFTCDASYGAIGSSTFVNGLFDSLSTEVICQDNPIAQENCPEVCGVDEGECRSDCRDIGKSTKEADLVRVPAADVSFTGQGLGPANQVGNFPVIGDYEGTKMYIASQDGDDYVVGRDFPYFDDSRGIYLSLSCLVLRQQPEWKEKGVCLTNEAREHCPYTCNACGNGCEDQEGGFFFRGEEHYCHEARGDSERFCSFDGPRKACPDTCGLFCKSNETGGSAGNNDCPTSDPDYVFSFFGTVIPAGVNPALPTGTSCAAIAGGLISVIAQAPTPGIMEAQLCATNSSNVQGPDAAFYASGVPYPGEACLAECNKLDASLYPCEATCDAVAAGTWVSVQYMQEMTPAQISQAANDGNGCKATVRILGDANTEVQYDNSSLTNTVSQCSCSNRVNDNSALACEEGGFCSRQTDGKCFPGETLCFI